MSTTGPDDKQLLYQFYEEYDYTPRQVDTYLPIVEHLKMHNSQKSDSFLIQIHTDYGKEEGPRIQRFITLFDDYESKRQASLLEQEERRAYAEITETRKKHVEDRLQELRLHDEARSPSPDERIPSAAEAALSATSFNISALEVTAETYILHAAAAKADLSPEPIKAKPAAAPVRLAPVPKANPKLETPKRPTPTSRKR